ncbi:homeobox protein prophet of Pit-1-like [Podarcis raffonei]|uniref:homeobox protein prophet of Pit-1-like n=1 Tax=Podarcis raffonei TaxID=65483 RepID=UPI0023295153|nr:homeobox protein prophet of Pit-1-like [Podarcis raffonei]
MKTTGRGRSYPKVGGDRRKRTVFTPAQIELLKKAFEENQYPGYETREALARCIGVEEDRVHIWFQNRRARTPKRIGSRIRIGNHAAAPYSHSERTCPRSSLDSSPRSSRGNLQNIHTQQHYQPQNFHYAESYGGAGLWQPPLNNTQAGEYAPQQQSSLELNPAYYQQAPFFCGTGLCETSQASNCPVPYYGAEMVRQPPPSSSNFFMASSSYTPWSATGNYSATNPVQMQNVDGSASDSQFFSLSQVPN